MTVSRSSTRRVLSVAYLDHDHRERENIRFLAIFPLVKNLWRGPSQGEAMLVRSAPYGIQVMSDLGEAEIRDAYMTGVFYKDVRLAGCQCSVKQDSERARTPLRSPCMTLQEWR